MVCAFGRFVFNMGAETGAALKRESGDFRRFLSLGDALNGAGEVAHMRRPKAENERSSHEEPRSFFGLYGD